jgi:hypothetical protein
MSEHLELPGERLPENERLARQRILGAYIAAQQAEPARRWFWPSGRLGRFAAAGAAASVLFAGTAAAYVAFAPQRIPADDDMRCYTTATLEDPPGDLEFYGTGMTQVNGPPGEDRTKTPAEATESCALVWRGGAFTLGSKEPTPGDFDEHARKPVPPLVACVLPGNGMVAVFPGDENTCRKLGIPRLAE